MKYSKDKYELNKCVLKVCINFLGFISSKQYTYTLVSMYEIKINESLIIKSSIGNEGIIDR